VEWSGICLASRAFGTCRHMGIQLGGSANGCIETATTCLLKAAGESRGTLASAKPFSRTRMTERSSGSVRSLPVGCS
jgi:hypothetical protein